MLDQSKRIDAPTTRYQGSKYKLLPWIWEHVRRFPFNSVLDAFGGTGSVAYLFKHMGKAVTYNDYLSFNQQIGIALIENSTVRLSEDDVQGLLLCAPGRIYDDVITRTFPGIFFNDDENAWLDRVCQNITQIEDEYKRALAYAALFQSCLAKRPYNLFHRKNLYLRTANVSRSFGNKASWDRPFEAHFRAFVSEINASVFDSGVPCRALCADALCAPGEYHLVYIDPPYVSGQGMGTDYRDFYHFLEGMVDYSGWAGRINYRRKHQPLIGERSPWSDKNRVSAAFEALFQRYASSILVVSYRSDGIPSEGQLVEMLRAVKPNVEVIHYGEYQYALSTNRRSGEILLLGY